MFLNTCLWQVCPSFPTLSLVEFLGACGILQPINKAVMAIFVPLYGLQQLTGIPSAMGFKFFRLSLYNYYLVDQF
jgi:hypothetical protein